MKRGINIINKKIDLTKFKNNNKGFSLIELIVVMAIIAILVLLAAPRFFGMSDEARKTQIINDVRVVEDKMAEFMVRNDYSMPESSVEVDIDDLITYSHEYKLYDINGLVTEFDIGGEYYRLPPSFIKREVNSRLKGFFVSSADGKIYYVSDTSDRSKMIPTPPIINLRPAASDNEMVATITYPVNSESREYKVGEEGTWQSTDETTINIATSYETIVFAKAGFKNKIIKETDTSNLAKPTITLSTTDKTKNIVMNVDGFPEDTAVKEYRTLDGWIAISDRDTEITENGVLHVRGLNKDGDIIAYASLQVENNISDFEYVTDNNAPNIYENGKKGYYKYIGTDEYVTVPYRINGNKIKDCYKMFSETNVKKVTLDNPNITNTKYMFENSQSTILDLSDFDTSKVTDMSYMFRNSQATSLDLSNFNTSSVTDMNGMFYFNKATSLNLSNFDTSNITNTRLMFGYSRATTLDLSSFDTSNVTNMYYMFGDSQATTLDLSNFDTSSVTDMSFMFCSTKTPSLDLSNFDTSSVTDMGSMFSGSQAASLDLSSFDTSNVTIMNGMFSGSQATSLDLSSFDTSSVTAMERMFDDSQATSLDLSNFDTSSVTNMRSMFYNNQAATLDLSNFDTSSVANMNSMFSGSQATSLDLSNFNTSSVTDMGQMFFKSQATSLDLSSFDTSYVTNMDHMFSSSKATIGYARTQDDADRLNNSIGRAYLLNFTIK